MQTSIDNGIINFKLYATGCEFLFSFKTEETYASIASELSALADEIRRNSNDYSVNISDGDAESNIVYSSGNRDRTLSFKQLYKNSDKKIMSNFILDLDADHFRYQICDSLENLAKTLFELPSTPETKPFCFSEKFRVNQKASPSSSPGKSIAVSNPNATHLGYKPYKFAAKAARPIVLSGEKCEDENDLPEEKHTLSSRERISLLKNHAVKHAGVDHDISDRTTVNALKAFGIQPSNRKVETRKNAVSGEKSYKSIDDSDGTTMDTSEIQSKQFNLSRKSRIEEETYNSVDLSKYKPALSSRERSDFSERLTPNAFEIHSRGKVFKSPASEEVYSNSPVEELNRYLSQQKDEYIPVKSSYAGKMSSSYAGFNSKFDTNDNSLDRKMPGSPIKHGISTPVKRLFFGKKKEDVAEQPIMDMRYGHNEKKHMKISGVTYKPPSSPNFSPDEYDDLEDF